MILNIFAFNPLFRLIGRKCSNHFFKLTSKILLPLSDVSQIFCEILPGIRILPEIAVDP